MEYNSIFLHLRRLLKFAEPSSEVVVVNRLSSAVENDLPSMDSRGFPRNAVNHRSSETENHLLGHSKSPTNEAVWTSSKTKKPSNLYVANKIVKIFLVLTMIVFRHFLSIYLIRYMWKQRGIIAGLPFWIGIASTLVFIPVNVGLSYRIYTSDFKKNRLVGDRKKKTG